MHALQIAGLARVTGSLAVLLLTGCEQVLDIPDDPRVVERSDPWRCLGKVPEPAAPTSQTAKVHVQACNFISTNCATPVTGITATLCDRLDVSCSNPIATDIKDEGGALIFEVSTGGVLGTGFDGYLQIAGPSELCTNEEVFGASSSVLCALVGCNTAAPSEVCRVPVFAPSLLFFNPNIRADVVQPIALPLLPTAALQPVLAAVGKTFDPTTGTLFISSRDCDGAPAADVAYDLNQHGDVASELYSINGNINGTARHTDSSGLGGFIGVPPGFVEVAGFLGDESGPRIGATGVRAVPFNVTYSNLVPTP